MNNLLSLSIILLLIIFDLLEPILRKKQLFFGLEIKKEKEYYKEVYLDYLKKVLLITLPIGILIWIFYPLENSLFAFFIGFLMLVVLNLGFYFLARKEIKKNEC